MQPYLIKVLQSFELILYLCENHAAKNALNNCLEDELLFNCLEDVILFEKAKTNL